MFSRFVRSNPMINSLHALTIRGSYSKLFVRGLSYDTNEPVLKNEFEKYGEIVEVKVISNHVSGKSKGYGFVLFHSEEAAASALACMNNQLLEGRNIRVEYAKAKQDLHQNQSWILKFFNSTET